MHVGVSQTRWTVKLAAIFYRFFAAHHRLFSPFRTSQATFSLAMTAADLDENYFMLGSSANDKPRH